MKPKGLPQPFVFLPELISGFFIPFLPEEDNGCWIIA